jgi:DNA-binding GntR family transcriptional regulator
VALSSRGAAGQLVLQTAPEAAAQALREAIISGELRGGDRILEQKWSMKLGIGQPTLREALRELEHQGLLRKVPQRGTYVTELSPDDYRQIHEVRIPLEAIAVGLTAKRMTPALEREFVEIVDTMADTETDLDVRRFHDCDVMFHRRIWETAENPYLQDLLETITFRIFVFSVVGRWPDNPKAADERHAAIQQHQGILAGLCSGDPAEARRAYVTSTVDYWNRQYGLRLHADELGLEPARRKAKPRGGAGDS